MARWLLTWLVLLSALPTLAGSVTLLRVEGGIDPAVAEYVQTGLRYAGDRGDALVVIEMDTPGGLSTSMESIVKAILASRAPVCVYVAPSGARAASAGAIIALAANFVAMAPATNIGAATPIAGISGSDLDRKIKNDAAAKARALAALRGRPVDLAQRVVLRAESITVDEAVRQGLCDVKANELTDVLRHLDGRKANGRVLHLSDASVDVNEMPLRLAILHLLANANVAYILMLVAIYGIIAELSHPGAVFPGVTGAIAALLAFYAFSVLTVNVTGLLLIALAIGLFIGDLSVAAHGSLAVGGAVAFVIGSLMLFRGPLGGVSPYLVSGCTVLTVAFFVGFLSLALRTRHRPAAVGREAMVGCIGVTRSELAPDHPGRVLFEGALWTARSATAIPRGQTVEVVAVNGLTLTVRPDQRV
ncbi:MAG TPA: NfeD family protein [Armatimonadota bacterium]|jgi:membrane-bound serine protease (ClpP class)